MGNYLPRLRFVFVYVLYGEAVYRSRELEDHMRSVDCRWTSSEGGCWEWGTVLVEVIVGQW